jgi:hypothetical protein
MARDIWCPFAEVRPLPENRTQRLKTTPGNKPTTTIDHTAVDAPGRTNLWGYFARADVTAESTYWIYRDGHAEQFMSCDVQANANRRADAFADSIETEDEGDPERWEWTDAQLHKMLEIHLWEIQTFGVSPFAATGPYLPQAVGQGYHSMWRTMAGGNPWTMYQGKTCPGSRRIRQWWGEFLPELQRQAAGLLPSTPKEWDEMASKNELIEVFRAEMKPVYELVGQVKAEQAKFEEDTRVLLEGCTVRLPGDPRQFLLVPDPSTGELTAVHVKDQAQLSLLKQAREVGANDTWNQVTVSGEAEAALRSLVE